MTAKEHNRRDNDGAEEQPVAAHLLWMAYAILLALLGTTLAVRFLIESRFAFIVHLALASGMAVTIFIYHLHLRSASGLIRLFAAGSVAWLVFMFVLLFADYLTRQ